MIHSVLEQCLAHARHVRGLSGGYVASIRHSCRAYFSHSGVTCPEKCNRDNVEAWLIEGRTKRNWGSATFRVRHRDVGFLFKYLVKRGVMQEDPTAHVDVPKLNASLPRGVSAENAETLLASVRRLPYAYRFERARNAAVIATMLFTGLRRQEALNLELSDVDFSQMTMRVVCGKGRKDRIVPISTRLAAILEEYLQERRRLGKGCPRFFTSAQHDSPLPAKSVTGLVGRLREKTGIRFTAHGLRHTFATLMLEGGCDLYTLSRMMGHSKITTTTIYLACTPKMLATSIEKHPLN